MRLLIMFDLPTQTPTDRKKYRQFHSLLINEGFLMLQESVYVRVCVNVPNANLIEHRVSLLEPENGTVNSLLVTEKQFTHMHWLSGMPTDDVRNTTKGLIII